ncbi:putative ABC transporter ATP-binding protein YbhF [Roseivivax jejudonensis]|uniref:Putative ABC transporter ATP-binding protein YbhF n=1 Tax=Roseivivax jejudonensis TaxID=1529041 RepID=A0A1X6Z5R7_9RHOB|nr:ABC transporter ATP-binding protein [Roseivivax jejudonensis]SLN40905.1 putative ABC transporter ATP-binding protein YbhF [Roseivivax jejudonensis]
MTRNDEGLSVHAVSYRYGAKTALDEVSFDVAPGRFAALLGPNGAGKSTLFALLTRLFTTPTGRIRIAGHDIARAPRAALARMGVVFQSPTLDLDLTIRQNLRYFAALHGLSGRDAERRIDAALARLDIAERAGERTRDLNGGHRRRTEIARALVHAPAVLLLDEPTVGLDAAARASITDHAHRLCAEDGLTVLWATHLTDEVRDDDRLVILHRGQIRADGEAGALRGPSGLTDYFLAETGVDPAVPPGPAA